MIPIRARLFLILLAATGAVWLSAMVWIQVSTRVEVARVLDRRLQEAAEMVTSLVRHNGGLANALPDGPASAPTPALPGLPGSHVLARQLICQVWGLDGTLKSESADAPDWPMGGPDSGFSERRVGEEVWRIYTHVDPELGIRVMVGDAASVREGLVSDLAMGLVIPALLTLPLMAAVIWLAVGRGLAPLATLARQLRRRPATDFSPLPDTGAPAELRPMLDALNGLFRRTEGARTRERNFTAFAAHELKTPLAGLKTQAQIALRAPDSATRDHALTQIIAGVDRSDRMVRQLLDMVAADSAEAPDRAPPATVPQDGAQLLAEVAEGLQPLAHSRQVRLQIRAEPGLWRCDAPALLAPALRNLLENAVLAAPPGTAVEAELNRQDGKAQFRILDRGPGIAPADRDRVTERFYRGAMARPQNGSGLGLAIVATVMARMGGELRLTPRPGGGEEALLILPLSSSSP